MIHLLSLPLLDYVRFREAEWIYSPLPKKKVPCRVTVDPYLISSITKKGRGTMSCRPHNISKVSLRWVRTLVCIPVGLWREMKKKSSAPRCFLVVE